MLVRFDVVAFAGRFDAGVSQGILDGIVDDMPGWLEDGETNFSDFTVVRSVGDYGVVTVAGVGYLGCRFDVEVHAR